MLTHILLVTFRIIILFGEYKKKSDWVLCNGNDRETLAIQNFHLKYFIIGVSAQDRNLVQGCACWRPNYFLVVNKDQCVPKLERE